MTEIEKPVPERKIWGPWATVGFGLVVFIVWFTAQTLAALAVAFPKLLSFLQSSAGQMDPFELMEAIEALLATQLGFITSVSVCISAIFGVGFVVLFTGVRKGVSIAEYLGLKRITVKQILAVLGITAGFIVLSDGLGILINVETSNEYMINTYNTSVWPALLWVSLIIFAPIFEEAFFRGFLLEGFRQSRLGPIGAVLLTALAWASLHIQYGIYEIALIFLMGILFGIVRIKTGSLWSTIIMHAFTNMVALVLIALQVEGFITWPG
jgi:membrane protease YdiL (CAAX protease family)